MKTIRLAPLGKNELNRTLIGKIIDWPNVQITLQAKFEPRNSYGSRSVVDIVAFTAHTNTVSTKGIALLSTEHDTIDIRIGDQFTAMWLAMRLVSSLLDVERGDNPARRLREEMSIP